jgi:hypothetical protein
VPTAEGWNVEVRMGTARLVLRVTRELDVELAA